MLAAIPSSKATVAADLRYSFAAEVLPNQPVMVHIAAIPRISGAKMKVSVQQSSGLKLAAGPLDVQKTDALGVYRQQFSLTKLSGTTEPLRVLVTMQMGEDTGFGYFTIPLSTAATDGGTIAQKRESAKHAE